MTEDGFWLAYQQCNKVVRTSSSEQCHGAHGKQSQQAWTWFAQALVASENYYLLPVHNMHNINTQLSDWVSRTSCPIQHIIDHSVSEFSSQSIALFIQANTQQPRQNTHNNTYVSGWTRGVQVKLWDPLRTRAIPERLRGVITTSCYANPRLPLT